MNKFYMIVYYNAAGESCIDSFWKELYNAESRLKYLSTHGSLPFEIEIIYTED